MFVWFFLNSKRQARSQTIVRREKLPDWPKTCFSTTPLTQKLNHTVIRPLHTWTNRIQATSTYKTLPLHSDQQVCFDCNCCPLLIARKKPHNSITLFIPESLLFRVGWKLPCRVQHTDSDTLSRSTDGRDVISTVGPCLGGLG